MVRKLITDKTPDQFKMHYALWTRAAMGQLIEQRFGIRLVMRTMGLYLGRWGCTPQKPMKKADEQSTAAVKKWLDEAFPVITACAKVEGPRFTGAIRRACAATTSADAVMRPEAKHL